jgi:hypothetical protein
VDKIPCENCVVLAVCRKHLTTYLDIIIHKDKCSLLHKYVTKGKECYHNPGNILNLIIFEREL